MPSTAEFVLPVMTPDTRLRLNSRWMMHDQQMTQDLVFVQWVQHQYCIAASAGDMMVILVLHYLFVMQLIVVSDTSGECL